ncbi:MAG: aminotransferase [Parvibaculaceae bacterium]|nr:aminotransferase [Parvibaculaceae bacterium]
MQPGNAVFSGLGTTIFSTMSAMAMEHGAINLGQGFPDDEGPVELRERAAQAIMAGPNQYPPSMGLPELRKAVANHDTRFYGLDVDWQTETLVTSGATEALADCFLALLNAGDEAILIEPFYDSYLPMVEATGAHAVTVGLEAPNWNLDLEMLAGAFSDKTKLIVVNTPMNPTGKVFTKAELQGIADLARKHDAYVILDEVYEHLVYAGAAHETMMALPGMRDRCVRIASAGKTFSLTGWKIGYVTAAPDLLALVNKAHQFVTFTTPPAFQIAVAWGLGQGDAYFQNLATDLEQKRDLLSKGLAAVGFDVVRSDGTYFVTTDISGLGYSRTDLDFCKEITANAGVSAIPVSPFYKPREGGIGIPRNMVRFCFSKQPEVLEESVFRLKRFFG